VELSSLLDEDLLRKSAQGRGPTYATIPQDLSIRAVISIVLTKDFPDHLIYLSPVGAIPLHDYIVAPELMKIGFSEVT
jgi:hypothetical protein